MNKENLPPFHELETRRKLSQLNRINIASKRHMWIDETLETTMDVIERERCSLRKAIKSWNIPLSSFFDHLNGKQRFKKMGPRGVLIES
jgi:hypothetical protein